MYGVLVCHVMTREIIPMLSWPQWSPLRVPCVTRGVVARGGKGYQYVTIINARPFAGCGLQPKAVYVLFNFKYETTFINATVSYFSSLSTVWQPIG